MGIKMELTIELNNDCIDIMEYHMSRRRMKITRHIRGEMPEGAFENGVIVDTNGVATAIRDMIKENQIRGQKAVLAVSSPETVRKELKIPKGPARHIRGLIGNELNKLEMQGKGYVFDYVPFDWKEDGEDQDKFQWYQVFLLPAELVKNYKTTLKRAGLILMRIEPVYDCMENLAGLMGLKDRKNMTILVSAEETDINLLMVGSGIKSMHRNIQIKEEGIEENIFIVSAVQQIQNLINTDEKAIESIVEGISKLVQFKSQVHKERKIERVFVYGSLLQGEGFLEALSSRIQIPTEACSQPLGIQFQPGEQKIPLYSYNNIGACSPALLGVKKPLSFLNLPGDAEYISVKDQIPVFIGLGCVLAVSVFYAITVMGNRQMQKETTACQEESREIEGQEEYHRRVKIKEELLGLMDYNSNCDLCIQTLEQSPRFESQLFSSVDALVPKGITIEGYHYENQTASYQCIATEQDGPARFARIVTDSRLFENVAYTGFHAYEGPEGGVYYSFLLECSGWRG